MFSICTCPVYVYRLYGRVRVRWLSACPVYICMSCTYPNVGAYLQVGCICTGPVYIYMFGVHLHDRCISTCSVGICTSWVYLRCPVWVYQFCVYLQALGRSTSSVWIRMVDVDRQGLWISTCSVRRYSGGVFVHVRRVSTWLGHEGDLVPNFAALFLLQVKLRC